MRERSQALKKIRLQTSKRNRKVKKTISDEQRAEMVKGILEANVDKENIVAASELPGEILGVEVDWDKVDVKSIKSKPKKNKKSKKKATKETTEDSQELDEE